MPETDEVCTGMDVPLGKWEAEDIAFWTGTERYQPWKDVASFFAGVADGTDSNPASR